MIVKVSVPTLNIPLRTIDKSERGFMLLPHFKSIKIKITRGNKRSLYLYYLVKGY